MTREEYIHWQEQVDYAFIQRVQAEVTKSCALPFALPIDRIPEYIRQAAEWFWLNCDQCAEERMYVVPSTEISKKCNNKIVTLPRCIIGVQGCYKVNDNLAWGNMGDFSIERMLMTTYSQFGGAGTVGGGFTGNGMTGFTLTDVVTSMYEISTFDQYLNPPLSYDYSPFSHKLVLLGELNNSDLLLDCWVGTRVQDLYNFHNFFEYVVALVEQNLSFIYGMFEFKLPGGVTINYSKLEEMASNRKEKIEEWVENHNANAFIFQPNTL